MRVCYATNRGLVRPENEDALRVGSLVVTSASMETPICIGLTPRGIPVNPEEHAAHSDNRYDITTPFWLAVADGMGGHAGGAIASSLVIQELGQWSATSDDEAALPLLFETLSAGLCARAAAGAPARMGTTLSALYFTPRFVYLFHVGDSRVYALTPFARLSRDDSRVQELVENRSVPERMRNSHPARNLLTKALMADRPAPQGIVRRLPLPSRETAESLYLLCTDGLWENFSEDEIKCICKQDMAQAARELLEKALARGANDNITFILVSL